MHELSLCRGLLQQVETLAGEHRAQAVSRITLRIGPLAGVEIPLLQSAFDIAREQTVAATATLEIESAPLRVHCDACEAEYAVDLSDLRCPVCHSAQTRLVSGDELLLVSIAFRG